MKCRCLIAEDEPIARDILRSYIARLENLELVGEAGDAVSAGTFLQNHPVDLLFLDIKMPRMSGLQLLRGLKIKPKVIIVSAYRDYALDAYDLDVIDYLLKPVSFERFIKAVEKATSSERRSTSKEPGEARHLYIKGNKQLRKVFVDKILFVESQRDYVRIHMAGDHDFTTRQTISYFEDLLPEEKFLRVHRSFIVAVDKVTAIESNRLHVGRHVISIGRQFKIAVTERLKELVPPT
jgi:two-component system LytT family response regulator